MPLTFRPPACSPNSDPKSPFLYAVLGGHGHFLLCLYTLRTKTSTRRYASRVLRFLRLTWASALREAATVATSATHERGNVAAVADVAASREGAIIRDNGEDGGFVL